MKHSTLQSRSHWGQSVLCAAVAAVACLFGEAPKQVQAVPSGYSLAWSDEFNGTVGTSPNSSNWNIDTGTGSNGWGNWELQTYVSDTGHLAIISDANATDGKALQITATDNNGGIGTLGTYSSGMIDSIGKQTTTYGYYEIRAKNPTGTGIWPAFWMLGTDNTTAGWPMCGEIDTMEIFGNNDGINLGSFHMEYGGGESSWTGSYTLAGGAQFSAAYHTFGLLWTPTVVTQYVDGTQYESWPSSTAGWIYDHPVYYTINLAVGGQAVGAPTASTVFPQYLDVDYLRYYTTTVGTSPGTSPVTDNANDFTVVYNTSGNWDIDTTNTSYFNGDTARFSRMYNGTEFINYKYPNVSAINATIYTYQPSNPGTTAVTAWYSTNNGTSYTQATTSTSSWTATTASWGYYTLQNSGSLPTGITDIKLQIVATGADWDTEIGKVTVTFGGSSAPSAPTNLTATPGNAQVGLTWTGSGGATSYNVYRGTTAGGESTTAIATGITVTNYTNTGLTNGTKYYYTVKALNTYGTSPASNEASATPTSGGGGTYGGTWTLKPYNATTLYLHATGTTSGSAVQASTTSSSWVTTDTGVTPSGDYTLTLSGYGVCLYAAGSTSGSAVEVYTCNGSSAESWNIVADGSPAGYYQLSPANAGTLVLDNTGTTNGSAVQVITSNSSSAQQWSGL